MFQFVKKKANLTSPTWERYHHVAGHPAGPGGDDGGESGVTENAHLVVGAVTAQQSCKQWIKSNEQT